MNDLPEPRDQKMMLTQREVQHVLYMRRAQTCSRKIDYDTEEFTMRVIIKRRSSDPRAPRLYPYHCDVCGKWHITHRPRK